MPTTPTTIIGPKQFAQQFTDSPPLVRVKRDWSDDEWVLAPDLRPLSYTRNATGDDLDSATFERNYGSVKDEHQLVTTNRGAVDRMGYWVRIDLVNPIGVHNEFVGRIVPTNRELEGPDVPDGAGSTVNSGLQTYTAFGPLHILRRISVTRSFWLIDNVKTEIGWLPDINKDDDRGIRLGNRSAVVDPDPPGDLDGTYLYGGTALWTRLQYLFYILQHFVDEGGTDGPSWSLQGAYKQLDKITSIVELPDSTRVSDIIRALIPRSLGFDYVIHKALDGSTVNGFVIEIFNLLSDEASYGGVTLETNENRVTIQVDDALNRVTSEVEVTDAHRYDRIRVLSERIVICRSFAGSKVTEESGITDTLERKWTAALEAAYLAGTGDEDDTAAAHRLYREGYEPFRMVFAALGAKDDDDMQGALAAVSFDLNGELEEDVASTFQTIVRATLPRLPMFEGFNYGQDPPVDNNPAGFKPDQAPPMAWVFGVSSIEQDLATWIPADQAGFNVSVLADAWGLLLNGQPNHKLAKGHWSDGAAPTEHLNPIDDEVGVYDYDDVVITIAHRMDHRLQLGVEPVTDVAPGSGHLDILVPGAECWVLAPGTIVGVNEFGELVNSGTKPRVLRNDTALMAATMAGAIARYYNKRASARIRFNQLIPLAHLLGRILFTVESGGDAQVVGTPITRLVYDCVEGTVVMVAGYAGQ